MNKDVYNRPIRHSFGLRNIVRSGTELNCTTYRLCIRGGPKFGFAELRPNIRYYSALLFFHLQRRTLLLFTLIFLVHYALCVTFISILVLRQSNCNV